MTYIDETLGEFLELPPFNHYYSFPISRMALTTDTTFYIIFFKMNDQLLAVNLESETGHTLSVKSATPFTKENLLLGLTAVPLPVLDTSYILELTQEDQDPSPKLKDIIANYHGNPQVMTYLKTGVNNHSTIKTLEQEILEQEQLASVYDPFRYTSRGELPDEKVTSLAIVESKDYEKIKDFHPLLISKKGKVLSVPVEYRDTKKDELVHIDIMGWYFYEKQLKIRWKPKHTRNRRWRSSLLSVDIASGNYFFQGEIYKKETAPVFLKDLNFSHRIPKTYLPNLENQFDILLKLIEEQKRKALLRKVLFNN